MIKAWFKLKIKSWFTWILLGPKLNFRGQSKQKSTSKTMANFYNILYKSNICS